MSGIFDSKALVAGVFTVQTDPEAARTAHQRLQASVAHRQLARQHARFASADAQLAALLPPTFDPGETWHILSNGDIDALSYVKHIMRGRRFGAVILSCWAINKSAIEWLQQEFDAQRLRRIDAYVGEIMPRDRPTLHHDLCALVQATGGRVISYRNHAKIWLFLADDASATVMETSANPNYNKRTEQTTIHAGAEVAATYKAWFDALDLPATTFPDWQPYAWPRPQAFAPQAH